MTNGLAETLSGKNHKQAYLLTCQLEEQSKQDAGLYPLLNDFLEMLKSPNSLVRARGFRLAAAQARWDKRNVIDEKVACLLEALHDPKGTTARQCLQSAGKILEAKPYQFPFFESSLAALDLSAYPEGIRPLIADDAARLAEHAERCRQLYLRPTEYIDWEDERIRTVAASLAESSANEIDLAKMTFEFVRDEIFHSYDVRCTVTAAKASDVLKVGASICWGKANLLSALLRANGIPSGISYQVLTRGETAESGYMTHALDTAYLEGHGWVRLDARGNKAGMDARFSLEEAALAYQVRPEEGERDFQNNDFDADPVLMGLIENSDNILDVRLDAAADA